MALNPDLLKILACPKCKQAVELNATGDELICRPCGLRYEIKDDIPIMLVDEAKPLSE